MAILKLWREPEAAADRNPSSKRQDEYHEILPNNILYPKEDKEQRILLYGCRNCDHQEVASDNCVYRNQIHHSERDQTQILQDVASDPTLPRTKAVRCAKCNHGEAVFFQATARGEEGMTLFFVCCNPNCGHRWRD